ncbi:hypothetical protein LPJGGPFB_03585 [Ensifer adhaerens]|uniref:hypothetical protein n=1 Tax=Ensifer adhaerens TaxID=106592 RepID=UPI00156826C8|nr:hypothetical protein [Ensifer adhaerens]NRP20326.1 hypothetical protein [Ensifer adhaerens]
MTETRRRGLAWAHGCLAVQSLGGMLGPVTFLLPDGRQVSPLHVAPWGGDPNRTALPPILQELRGEWPCVPFGSDGSRPLPKGWSDTGESFVGADVPHGHGSNVHWNWGDCDDRQIVLTCSYPEDHPVRQLRRSIVPDPNDAAIDITLEIEVRRPCRLPIGLHPTFRLTPRPGSVRLEPGKYNEAHSFPGDVEPGAALFAPGGRWSKLQSVDARDGTAVDATSVPLDQNAEELLQLVGIDGAIALHYRDEGFRVCLTWQKEHFPSLLLWYSNRGRTAYPWEGKHLALGVEPVCAAFDLGPAVSTADNPVASPASPTSLSFHPDQPFITRYRLSVEAAALG